VTNLPWYLQFLLDSLVVEKVFGGALNGFLPVLFQSNVVPRSPLDLLPKFPVLVPKPLVINNDLVIRLLEPGAAGGEQLIDWLWRAFMKHQRFCSL
jgi:hypothetical protein